MKRPPDDREPPKEGVEELLGELRGDQSAERGTFTVDSAAARKKLERYRLADPVTYVLELVQAAVLTGASHVNCHCAGGAFEIRFDGAPFSRAELEDLWGALLVGDGQSPRRPVIRQLATGLYGAMGASPTRITVRSGDGAEGVDLVIQGESEELTPSEQPTEGTHITVQGIPGSKIGPDNVSTLIRERCRYAEIPIEIDSVPISRGLTLPEDFAVDTFERDSLRGVAGFVPDLNDALVHLVQHGVWLGSRKLDPESAPAGYVAVVVSDSLRRDLSGARLVEDEALSEALSVGSGQVPELISRIREQLRQDKAMELPRPWLLAAQRWEPHQEHPLNLRSTPYQAPRRIDLPLLEDHLELHMGLWSTLERPFFWGGLAVLVLAAAGLIWRPPLPLALGAVAVALVGLSLLLLSLRVARPMRPAVERERRILAEGSLASGLLVRNDKTAIERAARAGQRKASLEVKVTEGPLTGRLFRLSAPRARHRAIRRLIPRQVEVYVDESQERAVLPEAVDAVLRPGASVESHLAFFGGRQDQRPPRSTLKLTLELPDEDAPIADGEPGKVDIPDRIVGAMLGAVAGTITGAVIVLLGCISGGGLPDVDPIPLWILISLGVFACLGATFGVIFGSEKLWSLIRKDLS